MIGELHNREAIITVSVVICVEKKWGIPYENAEVPFFYYLLPTCALFNVSSML